VNILKSTNTFKCRKGNETKDSSDSKYIIYCLLSVVSFLFQNFIIGWQKIEISQDDDVFNTFWQPDLTCALFY
jgi:hypothetical protein